MPLVPFCNVNNADQLLCYDFENDALPTVRDASQYGHHATANAATTHAIGRAGQGLLCTTSSVVSIPETATLDVEEQTIEMWFRPASIPASRRYGLFDNDGRFGLWIYPGGVLRCSAKGVTVDAPNPVGAGQWRHAACVLSITTLTTLVDGQAVAAAAVGTAFGASTAGSALCGNKPSSSPDAFDGTVDCVRIWRTTRTGAQITAAMACAPELP